METPYATLVKAAKSLQGIQLIRDWPDVSLDSVKEFFEINRSCLDLACEVLAQKPSVPLEYHSNWLPASADSIEALRQLSFVFSLEIHLSAHLRDYARAAKMGIVGLELSNAVRRGGLVLEALFSCGLAQSILEQLCRIRTEFLAPERRLLIDELVRIESERELFESILKRDKKWESIVKAQDPDEKDLDRLIDDIESNTEILVAKSGKRLVLTEAQRTEMKEHYLFVYNEKRNAPVEEQRAIMAEICREVLAKPPRDLQLQCLQMDLSCLCLLRMLAVDLGVRSFREEQGQYPETLKELPTDSGFSWPVDPFTSKPFPYRRIYKRKFFRVTEVIFDLYSHGPGEDQRGRFYGGPRRRGAKGKIEICLDWAKEDPFP